MKRLGIIILLIAAGLGITLGVFSFLALRQKNLSAYQESLEISNRSGLSIEEFTSRYLPSLGQSTSFRMACLIKRFQSVKPGNYRLDPSMSNADIIHHLRSGGNPVVNVRIDRASDIYQVAGLLGTMLRYDSIAFISTLLDPALLDSLQTDSFNVIGLVLPNTYEFYWNMSPQSFVERMMREQRELWTEERTLKTKALGLSARETVILASIVKAETANITEAPMIAGLYLNRLRIGMPLQSDPTTIFGTRFGARRVYLSDIQSDNPYNTYKIKGLPPGPINLPEEAYIDAVLNPAVHRYLYMCAQPGGTGRHNFAISLGEHERNRGEYIRWLNANKIN